MSLTESYPSLSACSPLCSSHPLSTSFGVTLFLPSQQWRSRGETRTRSCSFVLHVVALVVVLIAAQTCLVRYGKFVHAHVTTQATNLGLELWLPSSQVTLARELGVLEYMAFSFAANDAPDISLDHGLRPTFNELRLAAANFVNSQAHRPKALLPNIVFFHAESTFDPAAAFRLSARVELPLWSKQHETRALSPLRVNVIGGGKLGHGIRSDHWSRLQNLRVPGLLHPFRHRAESEELFRSIWSAEGYQTATFPSSRRQFL